MSGRWETVRVDRRVLVVARTVTSLNRALDVLAVFADDLRIQVTFVVSRGSRFGAKVPQVLEELEGRVIDWQEAVEQRFDLIISTSDHTDLHELNGPLALFSHGAGYMKYSPYNEETAEERAGLTNAALWRGGRAVPQLIGLSHENQRELVGGLADRAAVIGDPSFDLMTQLAGRREQLRHQLGLADGQRLVTVTSTWGPHSLLARWPTLPAQLLAALPWDEFRVAAVLHPNIWAAHGLWQIRHWLRTALRSGLLLLPPTGPWQIGLAAASCVVGDHGSLSAYSAGLGLPLVFGAFGKEEVPRDTAMWRLAQQAPRLNPRQPLERQIRDAIANVDHAVLRQAADDVFSEAGRSLPLLQSRLYEILELDPQHTPTSRDLPEFRAEASEPQAFHCVVADVDDAISAQRFPAALLELARPGRAHHLVAQRTAGEVTLQNAAAIVMGSEEPPTGTLTRYPGCRLVVCEADADALVLTERGGKQIRATTTDGLPADAWSVASAWIHTCSDAVVDRRRLPVELTIVVGGSRSRVRFTPA